MQLVALSSQLPMDNKKNNPNQYLKTKVLTASPEELQLMLYDGAIKFMKLAIKEIEAGNPEAKGEYITKAVNIIDELNTTLDMEVGGEIAMNLRKLYMFMVRHLAEANTKQNTEMIDEVISLMEELNQGWKAIAT